MSIEDRGRDKHHRVGGIDCCVLHNAFDELWVAGMFESGEHHLELDDDVV